MNNKLSIEFEKNKINILAGKKNKNFYIKDTLTVKLQNYNDWIDKECTEEYIANLIKENLKAKRINNRKAKVVLSNINNVLIRDMIIPFSKESNIYNIIKYESKDYFPVDMEEYIIDYKIIETINQNEIKKLKLLVVLMPKSIIEKIIKTLKLAGIRVECIDIEANSIAKYIEAYKKYKNINNSDSYLVLNIKDNYYTIDIVKNSNLNIAKVFTIDFDLDSEIQKENFINDVVENIGKVLNFYYSKERVEVEKIYVISFSEKSSELLTNIKEKINLDFTIIKNNEFLEFDKENEKENFKYVAAAGSLVQQL